MSYLKSNNEKLVYFSGCRDFICLEILTLYGNTSLSASPGKDRFKNENWHVQEVYMMTISNSMMELDMGSEMEAIELIIS